MEKLKGYYFGTVIDEKWWKKYLRYTFISRGAGKYWQTDEGIHFIRYFTKRSLFIPFDKICDTKISKSHSGRWGQGKPVLNIIWNNEDKHLNSGFIVGSSEKTLVIYKLLKDILKNLSKSNYITPKNRNR
ncbi:PH-like domain-containing protein [Alkaliphilus transvaalensis]|uniref:PH-like domain-containing protein n=1 Tax=Alkaliphilus transvaalensis TaxID=114628 RepID=UPI0012EC124D|nr:hypothetical protein [Alkaliphilus transvaalensis]